MRCGCGEEAVRYFYDLVAVRWSNGLCQSCVNMMRSVLATEMADSVLLEVTEEEFANLMEVREVMSS